MDCIVSFDFQLRRICPIPFHQVVALCEYRASISKKNIWNPFFSNIKNRRWSTTIGWGISPTEKLSYKSRRPPPPNQMDQVCRMKWKLDPWYCSESVGPNHRDPYSRKTTTKPVPRSIFMEVIKEIGYCPSIHGTTASPFFRNLGLIPCSTTSHFLDSFYSCSPNPSSSSTIMLERRWPTPVYER